MNQQKTRLVQKSIVRHLIGTSLSGWTTPEDWVRIGYLYANPSDPPAVSVPVPERITASFELGNTNRVGTYLVDIDCRAASNTQLTDLMDSIAENLDGLRIIDFNVKEPHEVGYDETTQTVARGYISDNVGTKVLDPQEFEGRVSFQLRESGAF